MIFRVFLLIFGIVILFLYTFPLFETKLNIGNIFGIALGIGMISVAVLFNMLKNLLFFKIAGIIAIITLSAFLAILTFIISRSGCTAKDEKTIIVLGCRVRGSKPSLSLIERCRVASKYMKEHEGAVAILSGGQGDDELISEAEAMLRLMTDFGIALDRLFIDDKSTSTDENILFSKRIIEEHELSRDIAIATSEYHEARAMLIAKKHGIKARALPCKTLSRVKLPFYTREVFGLIYEAIKNFK